MRKLLALVFTMACCFNFFSCDGGSSSGDSPDQFRIEVVSDVYVSLSEVAAANLDDLSSCADLFELHHPGDVLFVDEGEVITFYETDPSIYVSRRVHSDIAIPY